MLPRGGDGVNEEQVLTRSRSSVRLDEMLLRRGGGVDEEQMLA